MDPITIIGLASAIIQIVDTSGRLISKSCEIYGSADGSFRENSELEFLVTDLQRTNAKLARIPLQFTKGDVIDRDDRALRELCRGCNEVADELLDRLELLKVGAGGDPSKLSSVKYAWRFMRSEKELNALAARVAAYREQLHSRIMVSLTERFEGLELDQACRFDYLDRTGREILDSVKQSSMQIRTHVTTETANQTSYLTRYISSQTDEILSMIVQTRSVSPNPFASKEDATAGLTTGQSIHDMIEIGDFNAMHLALRRKPNAIYDENNNGESPLHVAVRKGDLIATQYLIRKGADKNADDNHDQTPLHLAARANHVNLIRLLISKGANPELQDDAGKTPADVAEPDSEAAWIFKVGPGLEDHDDRGYTALRHFVNLGKQDVVNSLLDRGADIHAPWEDQAGAPLMDAGINLDLDMMKLLLDRGADIEAPANPEHGGTSIVGLSKRGKFAAVEFLLDHGANIEAANTSGLTALHEAALHGHKYGLLLLLGRGAAMETHSEDGVSTLGFAAMGGHTDIVQILLERGAEVNNVPHATRCSPLHNSCENGFTDITRMLLEKGADTESRSLQGYYTPLCIAAMWGALESVRLLIEQGKANINVTNIDGWTPMMEASHWGHYETVKMLAEAGASVTTTNNIGQTALDIAREGGHNNIADYLRIKLPTESVEIKEKPN